MSPAERAGMPYPAASYLIEAAAGDFADAILASDWLAQRDRRVRAEAWEKPAPEENPMVVDANPEPADPELERVLRDLTANAGSGYCLDSCTWPHAHRFERDGVPWPRHKED